LQLVFLWAFYSQYPISFFLLLIECYPLLSTCVDQSSSQKVVCLIVLFWIFTNVSDGNIRNSLEIPFPLSFLVCIHYIAEQISSLFPEDLESFSCLQQVFLTLKVLDLFAFMFFTNFLTEFIKKCDSVQSSKYHTSKEHFIYCSINMLVGFMKSEFWVFWHWVDAPYRQFLVFYFWQTYLSVSLKDNFKFWHAYQWLAISRWMWLFGKGLPWSLIKFSFSSWLFTRTYLTGSSS